MLDTYTSAAEIETESTATKIFAKARPEIRKELSKTAFPVTTAFNLSPLEGGLENQTSALGFSTQFRDSEQLTHGKIDAKFQEASQGSIYFRSEPLSDDLRRGIQLLEEGRALLASALQFIDEGKYKDSDERIMDFKESLPELFCLRTISESFGALINALKNAIDNRNGVPLDRLQISTVEKTLMSMSREPAMSFDRAVEEIMKIEDAGFSVESPVFGSFLDLVEALQQNVPEGHENQSVS